MAKKRIKKSFNLKQEYKDTFRFIKESKKFIYIIIGIFVLFVLLGSFVPAPDFIKQKISEFIDQTSQKIQGMNLQQIIGFIISNNAQVSFFGIILGIFFGVIPIILTLSNGYILGFVFSVSVHNAGFLVLWRILPHGIFELPAVFISLGIGLRFGSLIFSKKGTGKLKEFSLNSIKVFLLVVIPLLIVAGIIEGFFVYYLG